MIQLVEPNRLLALLVLITISSGCASVTSQLEREGCEGLTSLPNTGTTRVCIQENYQPEDYGQARFDGVRIQSKPIGSSSSGTAPRPSRERYSVGPQQKKELEILAEKAFESALDGLQLERTDEDGAGVLLVRGQMLDVLFEAPTDPQSGAKYLFDRVGRATLVVELLDPESGALLLRAYDDRTTETPGTDVASQSNHLEQIASLWGTMLVESVGYLRGAERANQGT